MAATTHTGSQYAHSWSTIYWGRSGLEASDNAGHASGNDASIMHQILAATGNLSLAGTPAPLAGTPLPPLSHTPPISHTPPSATPPPHPSLAVPPTQQNLAANVAAYAAAANLNSGTLCCILHFHLVGQKFSRLVVRHGPADAHTEQITWRGSMYHIEAALVRELSLIQVYRTYFDSQDQDSRCWITPCPADQARHANCILRSYGLP